MVIMGTGDFAFEVATVIKDINKANYVNVHNLLGLVDCDDSTIGHHRHGLPVVASDASLASYAAQYPLLGIAMGIGAPTLKKKLATSLFPKIDNLVFPNIISPYCHLGDKASLHLGYGLIIAAGVTMTWEISLGNFVMLDRNVTLGHKTTIGDYSRVNPLSVIAGQVSIGQGVIVGSGASVKQNLIIGDNATIGMGAAVVKNVADNTTVIGAAAKPMIKTS